MHIETRESWKPGSVESVNFKPYNLEAWYTEPPWVYPGDLGRYLYNVAPWRRKFEAYTPNSDQNTRKWKDFEHYKIVSEAPNLTWNTGFPFVHNTAIATWSGSLADYGRPYHCGIHLDPTYGWVSGMCSYGEPWDPTLGLSPFYDRSLPTGGMTPLPTGLDDLKAAGLRACIPQIRASVSALNFLVELKDWKTLPHTWKRLKTWLLERSTAWGKIQKSTFWTSLYDPSARAGRRAAADLYLQTEFNILPFVSDMRGFITTLKSLSSDLRRLMKRAETPQKAHFCVRFPEYRTTDEREVISYDAHPERVWPRMGGLVAIRRLQVPEESKFCFTLEYSCYYYELQRQLAGLLAILDRWGINVNPRIVWNATKWTFIVDWVIGIGRWLQQFAMPWTEPLIIMHNCCWSVARRRTFYLTIDGGVGLSGKYHHSSSALPAVTETSYIRRCEMPSVSSFETSGLDLKEFSLAVTLAYANRKRSR